jgi:hypothetical protein
MTSGAAGDQRPNRALFAIGTATYKDPQYIETETVRANRCSVFQSVPQSLTTVIEAFQQSNVQPRLPACANADDRARGFLLDPPTTKLECALAEVGAAGDPVIIYYTGHGEDLEDPDGYYLITTDFERQYRLDTGVRAAHLPIRVVKRDKDGKVDPNQPAILLILDCCFSGTGALQAIEQQFRHQGGNAKLWVYATAGRIQSATSGVFATALAEALTRPRVGLSSEHIPIDTVRIDIEDALKRAAEKYGAKGKKQSAAIWQPPILCGDPKFFPNPAYQSAVAGLTVAEQHWISRVRAGPEEAPAGAGFYLTGCTGRVRAAEDLAHWINDPGDKRMVIVTGSPGSGKSALLSLLVLLTSPDSRNLVLTGTPPGSLAHQTAQLLSVHSRIVAVHARGLATDKVADAIAAGLGFDTVAAQEIPAGAETSTRAQSLLAALGDRPLQQPTPVVIVDAVDEATTDKASVSAPRDNLLHDLLLPLAEQHGVRVIVGTRRNVLANRTVAAAKVIDLDAQEYRDPQALVDYVRYLLVADREPGVRTPYQGADGQTHPATETVATGIADRATSPAGPAGNLAESFLIARVIALAVRARPEAIDTTVAEWAKQLPDDLAAAFNEDLARFGERGQTARVLLEALAWARGPGLPWETIWAPVARALAGLRGEVELSQRLSDDDVRWLLDGAGGAYVVEDLGPGGRSVFRPFHAVLGEYLRAQSVEYLRAQSVTGDNGSDADHSVRVQAKLTETLLDTLGPKGGRRWDWTPPYLRTYLGEHALAGGSDVFSALLGDSGFLAVADPSALTPLLGQAKPEQDGIVRSYRRARPLLGEDPAANAAYLHEAALAIGTPLISFAGAAISPAFQTKWTHVRPDHSLLTLTGHGERVRSVALCTGAGRRALLASGGDDGTVRLWDPNTGDPVGQPLKRHWHTGLGWLGTVFSVAFGTGAAGNVLLASGGGDGTVCVGSRHRPAVAAVASPQPGEEAGDFGSVRQRGRRAH